MKINSSFGDYKVEFLGLNESLDDSFNFDPNDVIILDKALLDKHHHFFENISNNIIPITAEESKKDYYEIGKIIEKLISYNFRKNHKIIAFGGGIIQDICGFISSTIYRGVDWVFYPTTVLAQGDSCLGGKTSISINQYKNLIGNFYPPKLIVIDTNFLKSLPNKDIRSGIGEMLHFYLVSSLKDYNFFKEHLSSVNGDLESINILTKKCLGIKKIFIEIDEFDKKERLVLNYGHTFGHAIESITNYMIPHGIAVSIGMNIANYISLEKGYIEEDLFLEIRDTIDKIIGDEIKKEWEESKFSFSSINLDDYVDILKKDKKNINENINCVLTKGPGNMFLEQINPSLIRKHLINYMKLKNNL